MQYYHFIGDKKPSLGGFELMLFGLVVILMLYVNSRPEMRIVNDDAALAIVDIKPPFSRE